VTPIERAKQHLKECEDAYREIGPAGLFGLMIMRPLRQRIDSGEESEGLIKEIMELS
jgi:hypothetical protein